MVTQTQIEYKIYLRKLHYWQEKIKQSKAKRKIIRAGRRGGKTVIAADITVDALLDGFHPVYATPTVDQLETWWFEVCQALRDPIDAGVFIKNETRHTVGRPDSLNRLKGKTAWNAETMRGDFANPLILDELQLMNEDTWEVVGAPMLLDNNGDAVFIYTPPSMRSAGVSKARDPRYAAKMFKKAQQDTTGRWEAFHFTSHDNPYISGEALQELIQDMSRQSYRQEILAEDDEIQLSWLVYRAFNERVCKIDDFEIPKSWLVYVGHDFGGANPAALFVAQDPATGNFYEFAEYLPGAGRATFEHVNKFKQIICLPGEYGKGKPETYNVIWRSGGSHQEEEIRQGYGAHGWPIMEPKISHVKAQVDRVIGTMERNKIFVFKSLYHRLEEIMNCLWSPDTEGRPTDKIKDEERYHLCACARYLYSNFTPETAVGNKPISKHSSFSRRR